MKRIACGAALGLGVTSVCLSAAASPPSVVVPADGAAGDHFGFSVAVSGTTAVVGAPGDNANGLSSGSAYVFVQSASGWALQAKLTATDGAAQASFGQAVAISGDSVVVGAPYAALAGTPAGAAYVFTRSGSTWTQQAKLSAADYVAYDYFGSTVSLSGNSVVVGSPYSDVFGADSGAVYSFSRSGNTWSSGTKVFPADSRSGDLFGASVSLDGTTFAAGAPNDADNAVASGSTYVFAKAGSAWIMAQKLRPTDGHNGDLFGNAVALSSNDLLIGAPENDAAAVAGGAAYHFARSGGLWAFNQKLTASDAAAGDFFGAAVALSGNRALVGAFLNDGIATDTGSAYVFTRAAATWTQAQTYLHPTPVAFDNWGAAVALDGINGFVGVDQDDDLGGASGSVFYVDMNLGPVPVSAPALGQGVLSQGVLGLGGLLSLLGALSQSTRRLFHRTRSRSRNS